MSVGDNNRSFDTLNFYEIFSLSFDSTKLETLPSIDSDKLKRTYRKLALQWHPDKHKQGKEREFAIAQFHRVGKAYETLGDPEKRAYYTELLKREIEIADALVSEEIHLEEFNQHQEDSTRSVYFTFPCRCSGQFIIEKDQIDLGFNV
eukprot:CAMPEP_0201556796 /NCGR_PEP_ID=MMETSP0173_2-20130828/57805_1 /ASSEMBLY_ACC=CAM_ASM_000268 /TAXON_ID=218659 /ORGANISM="Vexillifera sp., Strain DIVA3 564/2" /LENGTH=147 /DNA_ID=CAMNT_0047969295 /DNA_START=83 /DNA_END=523 /DNA_ORIENTATION=-